ncbi:MAG: thiamine-phosphate pyrophosphorylase [Campylobacteraceae bacterium]
MDKNSLGLVSLPNPILRLLDANLNRLREGIRVVEDIRRFCFDDEKNAKILKNLRHKARLEPYIKLLENRDILNDVLKTTTNSEKTREDLNSVQIANIKRAQESARVLEESLKLYDSHEAEKFKQIRYELYNLEIVLFT